MAPCQNLSPLQGPGCQNLSPVATQNVSGSTGDIETCSDDPASSLFQSFQEANQDPEPTERGPTGAATREGQAKAHPPTPPVAPPDDEPVTEDDYAAATTRLLAQGLDPAFLIRPVVLADVQRVRDEVARGPAAAPGQATAVTPTDRATLEPPVPPPAPAACPPARRPPQAPAAPACARPPTRTSPPTLRDVTLADLGDVGRLLALHEQARARGWLRGGEAEQLNVVAAAVHARRVGQAPCRLFVALLRDRRWEVITQEDEDQARALLRAQRDGPYRCSAVEAGTPVPEAPLSDDARFVLLAPQVLRQAGWRGEPFLGVKLHDPTWTRARWEQAQAELTQWRVQQAQARRPGSDLEPLAVPWVSGGGKDTEDIAETDD